MQGAAQQGDRTQGRGHVINRHEGERRKVKSEAASHRVKEPPSEAVVHARQDIERANVGVKVRDPRLRHLYAGLRWGAGMGEDEVQSTLHRA